MTRRYATNDELRALSQRMEVFELKLSGIHARLDNMAPYYIKCRKDLDPHVRLALLESHLATRWLDGLCSIEEVGRILGISIDQAYKTVAESLRLLHPYNKGQKP